MKILEGDEVFYFKNERGKWKGMILTHVNDTTLAGEETFLEEMLKGIIYYLGWRRNLFGGDVTRYKDLYECI